VDLFRPSLVLSGSSNTPIYTLALLTGEAAFYLLFNLTDKFSRNALTVVRTNRKLHVAFADGAMTSTMPASIPGSKFNRRRQTGSESLQSTGDKHHRSCPSSLKKFHGYHFMMACKLTKVQM
jgi:hypothetical protein